MGNATSDLTTEDLVEDLKSIGSNYHSKYSETIVESGLDGRIIASLTLDEVTECFQDLGITSIIHRKKIMLHFKDKYGNATAEITTTDQGVAILDPMPAPLGIPEAISANLSQSSATDISPPPPGDRDSVSTTPPPKPVSPNTPATTTVSDKSDQNIEAYSQFNDEPTDVFFTHSWGPDSRGRDNHGRVGDVVNDMKARGLSCWFDSDRMTGAVRKKMTNGIDNTKCMVVFVNQRYRDKVNGDDDRDNCRYEFTYGVEQKGPQCMIPVVMEPEMLNPRDWKGELGAALGTKLYVNLANDDEKTFKDACDQLYNDLMVIIARQDPSRAIDSSSTKLAVTRAPIPVGASFDGAPGSVIISGADGPRADMVNGVYEPTEELCGGMPVYRRKDKPNYWLECCQLGTLWKWYIKLTENRGETCLTSYGYCSCTNKPHDVCLPQDTVTADWSISTGNGFVHQPTVTVRRDPSKNVPEFLTRRLSTAQSTILKLVERPAAPGSVIIEGATGARAHMINGTYEPTEEMCNGLPVYRCKDSPDFWLECCQLGSVYKWYVKQTEYRGPKCLTSYGYASCSVNSHEVCLPQDAASPWTISTGNGFSVQTTVSIRCVYSATLPQNLTKALTDKRGAISSLLSRPSKPGSVVVSGATGPRDYMVNGIYEPVEFELCNNVVVYKSKESGEFWLELCQLGPFWKWYVKATENKGAECLTAYGYANCSIKQHDICLPQDAVGEWSISTGKGFVLQSSVTIRLASTDPIPNYIKSSLQSAREILAEKLARPPKQGSVVIAGATGPRDFMVNGIYEPTEETCHGLPVYHCKDSPDYWLEYIPTNEVGSWYVKSTVNRGPKSTTSYAYCKTVDKDGLPYTTVTGGWSVSTGNGFVKQSTVTCKFVNY